MNLMNDESELLSNWKLNTEWMKVDHKFVIFRCTFNHVMVMNIARFKNVWTKWIDDFVQFCTYCKKMARCQYQIMTSYQQIGNQFSNYLFLIIFVESTRLWISRARLKSNKNEMLCWQLFHHKMNFVESIKLWISSRARRLKFGIELNWIK